mmetsp:Transcript_18725/g.61748  ORF Transcript_18725/g.61748 Transcript_18725/m.61748 type:complete len:203 (-) Transcript_18725:302-910(-)
MYGALHTQITLSKTQAKLLSFNNANLGAHASHISHTCDTKDAFPPFAGAFLGRALWGPHPEELHLVGAVAVAHRGVDELDREPRLAHRVLQTGELIRPPLARREQARRPRRLDGLKEHRPRVAIVRDVSADDDVPRLREGAVGRFGPRPSPGKRRRRDRPTDAVRPRVLRRERKHLCVAVCRQHTRRSQLCRCHRPQACAGA